MNETVSASRRIQCAGLSIDGSLDAFVRQEILQGLGIDGDRFWKSFSAILWEVCFQSLANSESNDGGGPRGVGGTSWL